MSTPFDPAAAAEIAAAPLPTPATLKNRNNLFYQLIRFAAINLKMIKVIMSSH
ncbi:MAG: hypothetical protein FWD80_04690 [Propionibacteriaceae bacterium]|nr:hypothetical protein [Propionibacteriaceae bacterium]